MWVLIVIISIFLNASYCSNPQENAPAIRTPSKEVFDPNVFPSAAPSVKDSSEEVPYGFGSSRAVSKDNPIINLTSAMVHHLLVRRVVNLLLSKAHFKNSEGIDVPLEGVSNLQYGELKMTIALTANVTEIEILKEFGLKRKNLTVQQIDELITNLFTSVSPSLYWNLDYPTWRSWREFCTELIYKIEPVKAIYVLLFLCLFWIVVRIIKGKSSWKMLVLGIMATSFVMEFMRAYEGEIIKQHSEQIRIGKIPDHCFGEDKRTWWQNLFSGNPKDECHEYHIFKNSNPLLRVSLLEVFLNQIQLFIDPCVNTFRKLTAKYEGDWFFENIIYRVIIMSTIGVCAVILIVIKFGGVISLPFFMSIKRDNQRIIKGSQVEPMPIEDTPEPIRRPSRRKRESTKKTMDCIDSRENSSAPAIILKVEKGTFNLSPSMFNNQPGLKDVSMDKSLSEKENNMSSEESNQDYTDTEEEDNTVHSTTGTNATNKKRDNFAANSTFSVFD